MTIIENNEKRFEQDIESFLISKKGGYLKGDPKAFNSKLGLDVSALMTFIQTTQPKEWARYEKIYGENAVETFIKRFSSSVSNFGLLYTLRHDLADHGVKFKLAYFMPSSALNPDLIDLYNKNILTCTRQFAYSPDNHNTIDMVLSLNGIPVVALELKNQLKGQSVDNAKSQFMTDRDPRELVFQFDKRFLVYFAVDLYDVYMTTRLEGMKTYFLPFNQGSNGAGFVGGAGNPANPEGYSTSYLWEKVLQKDMLMSLLHRYISRQKSTSTIMVNGKKQTKTSERLIFPRYHQLDVVEKVIADVRKKGSGKNYLIQHSAGSGKSNSIAWLTYRLASLHDKFDEEIFNSVIIVTDRRVLDKQLQDTISGFDHKLGQVELIDNKKTSDDLRQAIDDGKRIIITTLQKFPVIYQKVKDTTGRKFAIIVDEAHSSQTGNSAKKLKSALADRTDAYIEYKELEGIEDDIEEIDSEDVVLQEVLSHGQHKNLSFFGFTATPKPKTLEMFGEKLPNGNFAPFHIYSMRQAIEEGFILDVLQCYTTMQNYFRIIKDTEGNPQYKETPAIKAIKKYYVNHERVIEDYVRVVVEKFREVTLTKLNGKAKAMVICPSRIYAVKFYQAINEYIAKKHYTDINTLIAFSGSLQIGDQEYTESKMNHTADGKRISEDQLKYHFAGDEFNTLIVADKYQTGFDEPMLHTMFVLKKLNGVKAVQTLSRLNRTCPGKHDTFVLDFVNTAEDIQKSFQPYYEDTKLEKEFNVNLVYDNLTKLQKFCLFNDDDVEAVTKLLFKKGEQTSTDLGKVTSLIKPTVDRYNDLEEKRRYECRDAIKSFNKFYAYITQITRMFDKDLYKTYIFTEYLAKLLPRRASERINLDDKVKLEFSNMRQTFTGAITLEKQKDNVLKPMTDASGKPDTEKVELLENIIDKINIMFEGKFDEKDRVIVETIYNRIANGDNKKLKKYAKNTDPDMFTKSIFPKEFENVAQDCYVSQMEAFAKLFENKEFYEKVMTAMGKALYQSLRK